MSELIQWPRAKYWTDAWNPIVGCRACSPACANCYAAAWAERFKQSFEPHETKWRRPPQKGVVFCGNMTDLFGPWVGWPGDYIERTAFGKASAYLYLTKRTGRMMTALLNGGVHVTDGPPEEQRMDGEEIPFSKFGFPAHYFGFTAEDQTHYAERLWPVYRGREDWMKCWVSCEPLLGPVNLRLGSELICRCISWVVVGCESGPHRRPCKLEWVESIVHQCVCAGVPVFVKQLDLGGRCVTDITRFPEHLRVRQVPWAVHGGAAANADEGR